MLKSLQFKIIISFIIFGMIFAFGISIINVNNLEKINDGVLKVDSAGDTKVLIDENIEYIKRTTIILSTAYIICMILIGIVISKVLISPVESLVKSAEHATKGMKYNEIGKSKNEIKNLATTFDQMNNELKENLNEATRARKQTAAILLHMTDGILAFNMKGDLIHINPAAQDFMKITTENSFNEIFEKYGDDMNLEKIIYLENMTSFQKKIVLEDKTINLLFAPYKDENERAAGMVVVVQDITERERLDSMRKRFVADVSHELKTPITSIMGYADTLLEDEVDSETNQKFLNRISGEAARMSKLVNDLLVLSKFDSSRNNNIEKAPFDLGKLTKEMFESLEIEMAKKNLVGDCYVTSNVPLAYADKNGIERVIVNVLTNAIKYTPDGGEVQAYVGCVYNDAYIKIIDTGIGIPKDDLDKIFERFYRVDKARTRQMGGSGLGLSIAKEIIDQNNCKIDIKSEVGKGTEVVIRIPTIKGREQEIKKEEKIEKAIKENIVM